MDADAKRDLAMIRQLMEESRTAVVDRGAHFLIWGVLPVPALVLTYLVASGRSDLNPVWAWGAVLLVGWAASLFVGARAEAVARVRTAGRRLLSVTWVASAVGFTLVALAGMIGPVLGHASLPGVLALMLGAPILATAELTGERWMRAIAAGWWLGGALMLFVPGSYTLLLMAAMTLLLMAVPGLILHGRARRGTRGAGAEAAGTAGG